jgi:hypothetical protein
MHRHQRCDVMCKGSIHPVCLTHQKFARLCVVKDTMKDNYGRPFFVCSERKNPWKFWQWGDVFEGPRPSCQHGIVYLCSNDVLNLAWTRTCLRIFVFRSLFLTWRGRVHAIYICYIYFFTWHECVHACHCCHGRVHAKLKKSLEHKYTMAWMSPRQAKFKRSLEHKYTMAWTRPRQV